VCFCFRYLVLDRFDVERVRGFGGEEMGGATHGEPTSVRALRSRLRMTSNLRQWKGLSPRLGRLAPFAPAAIFILYVGAQFLILILRAPSRGVSNSFPATRFIPLQGFAFRPCRQTPPPGDWTILTLNSSPLWLFSFRRV